MREQLRHQVVPAWTRSTSAENFERDVQEAAEEAASALSPRAMGKSRKSARVCENNMMAAPGMMFPNMPGNGMNPMASMMNPFMFQQQQQLQQMPMTSASVNSLNQERICKVDR